MKLKKFLKLINEAVEKNPELLKATVVYSIDEEGNAFHKVEVTATPGIYKGGDFDLSYENVNAICIN